jgi:hypothetical protein
VRCGLRYRASPAPPLTPRRAQRARARSHPDKNPSPEAAVAFKGMATAYEVRPRSRRLAPERADGAVEWRWPGRGGGSRRARATQVLYDDATRTEYDYVRAHPEEFYGNRYRYYKFVYRQTSVRWRTRARTHRAAQQTGVRITPSQVWAVLGGVLLVATVCHYLYWVRSHQYLLRVLRTNDKVRKKMAEAVQPRVRGSATHSCCRNTRDAWRAGLGTDTRHASGRCAHRGRALPPDRGRADREGERAGLRRARRLERYATALWSTLSAMARHTCF